MTGAHRGEEETPPGGAPPAGAFLCLNVILTVNTYKYTLKHLVHGFSINFQWSSSDSGETGSAQAVIGRPPAVTWLLHTASHDLVEIPQYI